MMLLRIYALYYTRQWVVRCVALLLLVQTVVYGWLLTRGVGKDWFLFFSILSNFFGLAVAHNPHSGVHGRYLIFRLLWFNVKFFPACTMIFDPDMFVLLLGRSRCMYWYAAIPSTEELLRHRLPGYLCFMTLSPRDLPSIAPFHQFEISVRCT